MSSDKIEVPFFTDKAGQVVKRGDYIVYGQLLGRSASLNFGKVVTAMIEDVKREMIDGEIEWTKDVEKAIGRKAAEIYKRRFSLEKI